MSLEAIYSNVLKRPTTISELPRFCRYPSTYKTKGYSRTVTYHNFTHEKMVVMDRANMRLVVPTSQPELQMLEYDNHFIVVVDYHFESIEQAKLAINGSRMEAHDKSMQAELIALEQGLLRVQEERMARALRLSEAVDIKMEYLVHMRAIRNGGGFVYVDETDLCVYQADISEAYHPYSKIGELRRLHESKLFALDSAACAYQIIDNAGEFGDRFMKIGKIIYKVVAEQNPDRQDGFYHYQKNVAKNAMSAKLGGNDVTAYYGFDDPALKEFRLQLTYLEAVEDDPYEEIHKSFEREKMASEEARLDMERELAIGRKALADMKIDHDKYVIAADKEKEIREQQYLQVNRTMEVEKMEKRYAHEAKSMQRKDWSEALKLFPALLVGIGACFLYFKTMMKPAVQAFKMLRLF